MWKNGQKCIKSAQKFQRARNAFSPAYISCPQLGPLELKKKVTKSKCCHPLPTLWAHKKMQNAHNILHFFVLFSEMIQPFEKMISHCKGFGGGGAGPGTQGTHTWSCPGNLSLTGEVVSGTLYQQYNYTIAGFVFHNPVWPGFGPVSTGLLSHKGKLQVPYSTNLLLWRSFRGLLALQAAQVDCSG